MDVPILGDRACCFLTNREEESTMNLMPRDTWLDIDKVFDNFFAPSRFISDEERAFFTPHVDIVEKDGHYEIKADLPGVKKEDLKVNLEDGVLTIEASHKEEKDEKEEGKVIRRERRTGRFMRSFTLGSNVEDKDIKANFNDGVLVIEVPKAKPETPATRQIAVD
jgi:HSP20 family protein